MIIKKITVFFIFLFIFITLLSATLAGCEVTDSPARFEIEENGKQADNSTNATAVDSYSDSMELFFNIKNKQKDKNILNNINIRRAIFCAIDRERIVNELFEDKNTVLNSMFGSNSFYAYPVWNKLEYNKEKAVDYLKAAGYGPDNPLYLTISANDNSLTRKKIEEIIKENLEEIGIKIWLSNYSSNEWYGTYLKTGNYELALWSLYTADPDVLVNYFSSSKIPVNETAENQNCNNFYWYSDADIDEQLQKLTLIKNPNEKKAILDEIQNKIYEDSFLLPLFSRLYAVAYKEGIENIKINPYDGNFLSNISELKLNLSDREDGELIIGTDNILSTLNPLLEQSSFMNYLNSLIMRGLWKPDKDGIYIPDLIDEKKSKTAISRADNSIFITLKDNAFWQDGTKVTSEDVKATIKAITNDKNLNLKETGYKKIKEITTVSDTEFYIYFTDPVQNYEKLFSFILPEKMLDSIKISDALIESSFGCGQYKVTEWSKNSHITLEKNNYFENNISDVSKIKILFFDDKNLLVSALKNGDIDLTGIPVDMSLINKLEADKKINVRIEKGNLWEQLAICLRRVE